MIIRKTRLIQAFGVVLFIVAYWLPVLGDMSFDPGSRFIGYMCARYAIPFAIDLFRESRLQAVAVLLSELINVLVPVYFALSFVSGMARLRTILMHATFLCILATWLWFVLNKAMPLYGNFVWIAGALLIQLPCWLADRKISVHTE